MPSPICTGVLLPFVCCSYPLFPFSLSGMYSVQFVNSSYMENDAGKLLMRGRHCVMSLRQGTRNANRCSMKQQHPAACLLPSSRHRTASLHA